MDVYFVSGNEYKISEVKHILDSRIITVISFKEKINEIQSEDMEVIVKDKAIKAFKIIGRPLLVEQTGLLLDKLGGLPGGLTQVFWDSLKEDSFCNIFSPTGTAALAARTVLAYCDGKTIKTFDGEVRGIIVKEPRGCRDFQWDCIFQPNGFDKTFAEMGSQKNKISMRKIALEKFRMHLESIYD